MKSNRILQLVLVALIVVFLGAAGLLYAADSREGTRQEELTGAIANNQAILNNGLAEKAAKETEAAGLASQLAGARALLAQTDFLASVESIEYDRILFAIADTAKLQVTSLTATAPLDIKEKNTTYQLTTFTVTVEGKTPATIFKTVPDSTTYITGTVNNILAFVNEVATGSDFNTAVIQSVNITSPEPMTAVEIGNLIKGINDQVRAGLPEADTQGKTEEQIVLLVSQKLAAMTPEDIKALLELAGIDKPSAVITIKVWTYKGA
jgi:hypothetical protein